jgi:hypothetical protein
MDQENKNYGRTFKFEKSQNQPDVEFFDPQCAAQPACAGRLWIRPCWMSVK